MLTSVTAVLGLSAFAQFHGRLGIWDLLLAAPWPYLAYHLWLDRLQTQSQLSQQETGEKLAQAYRATTEALTTAIAAKDSYTRHHDSRVQHICEMVAHKLGLDQDTIEGISIAALVRDTGKLGVPDYILLKPGPLDPEEFARMRNHAVIGAHILENTSYPWDIAGMVRHHHEKYDGTGYPNHIAGEHIPLGSRIIAVADVYDALISDRCYRNGWSHHEAVEHIQRLAGSSFDPKVVRAFMEVEPEIMNLPKWQESDESASHESAVEDNYAAADMIAQANRELVSLFEITQTLSSTLEIDEVLALLAHRTRRLLQASTCAVFLTDEAHPKSLIARAVVGRHEDALRGARAWSGKGVTGKVALHQHPHVGNYDPNDLTLGAESRLTQEIKSGAVVPIVSFGELVGTINVYDVCSRAFSSDDLRMLMFVAHQAALAVQNARAFEKARESALRDPLTNLHNGRFLRHYLERELSRSTRLNEPLSILGIDLDSFKLVNDIKGHQAGDTVLRDVADIFRRVLRDYDVIVRNGGDEFVVVLPGTPAEEAIQTAARIRDEVECYGKRTMSGIVGFGASVGVASYPDDATDVESLLAKADAAMYRDKRSQKQGHLAA